MASPDPNAQTSIDTDALITQLRRKQGTWVEWGQACQTLQKVGLNPQKIFEETGFEPIHQNQLIVAAQVYSSIVTVEAPKPVQAHFEQRGSDVLYELRILSQRNRARAAELALNQSIDADDIKEIAKALKEYSYFKEPPHGFTDTAGDAVAYNYWRLARQQADLSTRSRLIGQGLRFATSTTARQQIEKLLTDLTVVKSRPAPRLPVYRLETDSDLPCIIPVAGKFPLATTDFTAVPVTIPEEPFSIVKFEGTGAWAPIPGWQVILQAEDPVGIVAQVRHLPNVQDPNSEEPVLLVVDRAQRGWDADSYFVVDQAESLSVQWFADMPDQKLLGKLILVMLPKRILDENYTRELWQFEE